MPTARVLFSYFVGAALSPVLTGCEPADISSVIVLGDRPVALGAPRPLPDGDIVVAGTLLAETGVGAVGGFVARIAPAEEPSLHALEGEDWSADEYRFAVTQDGRVAFALQRGFFASAVTSVGILDSQAEVVWTRDIKGLSPTVLDADASGNIVLGGRFSAAVAVDGGAIEPDHQDEGIALRVTPGGEARLLFRGEDSELDVNVVRFREDGSGLLATSRRSHNSTFTGPVLAFDPQGEILWNRSHGEDVSDIAPAPDGGAWLLKGSLWADTVVRLDAEGAPLGETAVGPLRVPPGNLRMQVVPRIDLDSQGQVLVSGATYAQEGDPDAHVAALDAQGQIAWEVTMGSLGRDTLSASWSPSGEVIATLTVEDLELGHRSIGGRTIVHRAYRDDIVVKLNVPE